MKKRIIVAGAGHGGIATGMMLAKEGFDVTVFEKNSKENMGHDWTDAFDRKVFEIIGIPMPDEILEADGELRFYATDNGKVIASDCGELQYTDYGISGIPCIVVVDPQGMIIARDVRGEDLKQLIDEKLSEKNYYLKIFNT